MRIIKDVDVQNKRVLVRADFNVDLDKKGNIIDDFRIKAVIPTIEYLVKNKAKVILMSHLGDPKSEAEESLRMNPIQDRLMEYLDLSIVKADDCVGQKIEEWTIEMRPGEILLLENLRFNPGEKKNDESFAKKLAKLGDIYVNDAFAVSHREHASVVAITKFLPSYMGLSLESEIEVLTKVTQQPEHPLVVIIGGAKISTKIKLIKNFLSMADNILLGGALANTALRAKGIAIGKSVIEKEMIEIVKNLELTNTKIHMPVDTIVSVDKSGNESSREAPVGKMEENELILDIGPETENLFAEIIKNAKTVIWNGPMGLFEVDKFSHGTKEIAMAVADCHCYSVIGGGETVSYINKLGLAEKFSHISTGGGAMLKFLAGEKLPGIEALKNLNIKV